jgi:hypothetical protein
MIGMKKYLFGLGKMNRVILFLIAFFWLGGCSMTGVRIFTGTVVADSHGNPCGGSLTIGNRWEGICFCERELMKPDQLATNFPDHDEVIEKIKKVNSFMRQEALCPKSNGVEVEGVIESVGYTCNPGPSILYNACLPYDGGPSKANFEKWIIDGNLEKAWATFVGCKESWLGKDSCQKFLYGDQPKFN